MDRLQILLLASIILLVSCAKEKDDVGIQLINNLQKYESVHYKVLQQSYASNLTDTTKTSYEIWIQNKPDKYIWVDDFYRPSHFIFEKGKYYLTIPPKKYTAVYPNLDEDMISPVDWITVFAEPESFKKILLDKQNQVLITDTIFQNEKSSYIKIVFPKSSKGEQIIHHYVITKDFKPKWTQFQLIDAEKIYRSELFFTAYSLDNVDQKALKEKHAQLLAANPIRKKIENSEISIIESMLHLGDEAPLFKGNVYDNGSPFELNDYISKHVIILDFWYTHCPPCVKAIPELVKLQEEYKSLGLKTFGLNSVDNNERSKKTLDKFLGKRMLNYDIILTQSEVDLAYKIKSYPSLYVIDKKGKVVYIELGYTKEKFKLFKAKIKALLEE